MLINKFTSIAPLFTEVINTNGLKMQKAPTQSNPAYSYPYIDSEGNSVLFGNVYSLNTPATIDRGIHIPIGRTKFPYQGKNETEEHAVAVIVIKDTGAVVISTTSMGYDNKLWVKQKYTVKDYKEMFSIIKPHKLLEIYDSLGITYDIKLKLNG